MADVLENIAQQYVAARENARGTALFPTYSTGARSYIRVGGKPVAVAMDFRWQISSSASEIRTIDTNLPWDLVPNQITISASLSKFVDPSKSLEGEGLFHTIQSMIHQPYVEMQALDASGHSIFFARGMFTGMNGNIARGQLSTWGANFQGVAYQHNVFQEFRPYNDSLIQNALDIINDTLGDISDFTGGFL